MKPTFKLSDSGTYFITDTWLCNGHWAIKRNVAAEHPHAPPGLRRMDRMRNGRYYPKLTATPTLERVPDIDAIVPRRDGYRKLSPQPIDVMFKNDAVEAYIYETEHVTDREPIRIGVKVDYVPLLKMGFMFARDPLSPIILLNEPTLNADTLFGVVMPMRVPTKPTPPIVMPC